MKIFTPPKINLEGRKQIWFIKTENDYVNDIINGVITGILFYSIFIMTFLKYYN